MTVDNELSDTMNIGKAVKGWYRKGPIWAQARAVVPIETVANNMQ